MKFITKTTALLLFLVATTFAANKDLYFFEKNLDQNFCEAEQPYAVYCNDTKNIRNLVSPFHRVRIRAIDPVESADTKYGFILERPFFIIDGIHLSTDEERTLDGLEEETKAFGIPGMLKALGYTPILVQFPFTVNVSLQDNSLSFSKLLKFLNDNTAIPFPNKKEEGFIVLGISQGGILGRYGAYLYDKERKTDDAPISLYASLDSPHQGAVMPRGLISTINFWASESNAAAAFNDLIKGPGAKDLLIYQTDNENAPANTSSSRFLFGDYRNAAEYKGFPSILISQGQLKGKDPEHSTLYYNLNRKAQKAGVTVGRAVSRIGYSNTSTGEFAHNSVYEISKRDVSSTNKNTTAFDFVQGSTYPFPKTMYESLREGILDQMPHNMSQPLPLGFEINLSTSWDRDGLYQESSTFIPTVSAMDLKCDGDLAIRSNCAHNQTANGIEFENPGSTSTGSATFAVDPTHPRFDEAISGRHIEPPIKGGKIMQNVLDGMQTDVWRLMCEIAKYDYDNGNKSFRNPKLTGYFSPTTSCMDQTKIPDVIKNIGNIQTKPIGYARYDYIESGTESDDFVSFNLPAGWNKSATYNIPDSIPVGASFEVDIAVTNAKTNWMKAELLLQRNVNGSKQIQLNELSIPLDGNFHTLRWSLPNTENATMEYKWLRLVLNSDGAYVTLSKPRIITNTQDFSEIPQAIESSRIYPNNSYSITPWSSTVSLKEQSSEHGTVLKVETALRYDGLHIDFGDMTYLGNYSDLVIGFVPGSCTRTAVYFDANDTGSPNLANYSLQNGLAYKILPLSQIINTQVTPKQSLSARRLKVQATRDNEICYIKEIYLK